MFTINTSHIESNDLIQETRTICNLEINLDLVNLFVRNE